MRNGFQSARRLHDKALAEFAIAASRRDRDSIRQAAEKGWLSAVEAAKALLAARGRPPPGGTGRQRDALIRLARSNPRARELPRLFGLVRETLHISCFYDDEFTPGTVEAVLEEAGEFIRLAETLATRR